jgi:YidC/Oxa1 family membrane protein insertase
MRGKMMTAFAFVMGAVTAWQAAGLQLYFLVSGVLGAGTGYLLRQNWFRRAIRIRPLPSKESTEIYSKVVRGEVKLSDIKGKDGKLRYEAPRAPTHRRTATTLSGIKIREGTSIPAHLKVDAPTKLVSERPDRDEDYEAGAEGSMMEKLDYYRRNYRLAYMYRRLQGSIDKSMTKMGYGKKGTQVQQKRKMRAEQYEIERRRRFENRS